MNETYLLTFSRKREIFQGKQPAVLLTAAHGGTYSFTADEYDLIVLFDGSRNLDQVQTDFYKRKNVSFDRKKLESFAARLLEEGLLTRKGEGADAEEQHTDSNIEEEVINETVREAVGARPGRQSSNPENSLAKAVDHHAATEPGAKAKPAHAEAIEELRGELEHDRPKIRIPLWSRPLAPMGYVLSMPARNKVFLAILIFMTAGAVFGVLSSWDVFYRDVSRLLGQTNLIQAMLISLVVVNLFTQISKASIFKSETGVDAPFGIALYARVLPRFYADTVDIQYIRNRRKRIKLRGSDLTTLMFIFVLSAVGWLSSRSAGTFLPLAFAWTTLVSAFTFLFQINPLVKGAGYDILSAALGMGDLRERALTSTFRLRERAAGWGNQEEKPYPWGIRLYGICIGAFLLCVCWLLFTMLGPWLEARWGGQGYSSCYLLWQRAF